MPKKMIVILEQKIRLPRRNIEETMTRAFTVYANTREQAIKAVKDAGHKGKVISVEVD